MPRLTFRTSIVAAALAVAAWGLTAYADPPDDGLKKKAEGRESQDGPPRRPGPRSPLETILDQDHDDEISAEEIQDAAMSLKKLDKNGDGKLTPDEYRPRRPDSQARGEGPRDGRGPGEGRGPRDGAGPREGRGPRDADGPREGRGPRDGEGPPRDGKRPARDGDKAGGDCPDKKDAGKQKSEGKDE